ncbi:MAG: Cys-tRNA(Pro) deacylase [Synergistaceae bacterium]|jgi:Cys-tRNA(Pro)/Cys-tRNA(Cys) deacylase|nr:Cys-tRNA(Pro) deacylase [Synergistaceae bacterium]
MSPSKGLKKTNAARILDEMGIPYELIGFEADERDLSAERAARDIGMSYELVYKTLVLRGDKAGVLEACLPAGLEVDLKALAEISGNKRVEMVNLKELTALTGYVRGGCSPIGGKKHYPVYIYEDAMQYEKISVSAGSRGLMFLMSPQDLVKATNATPGKIATGITPAESRR